jgi:hypothetical protein
MRDWLGRRRILICGDEPLTQQVAKGLSDDGSTVAVIPTDALATLEMRSVRTLILADPPDASSLTAMLIARARAAPRRWRQPRQRLILMHRSDPPPRVPESKPDDRLQIETFAIEDRAARALLLRWPLHLSIDPRIDQRPHLLIVGSDAPARAVLIHSLRLIHYGSGRPQITVACPDAQTHLAEWLATAREAERIADIRGLSLADLSADAVLDQLAPLLAAPASTPGAAGMDAAPSAHDAPLAIPLTWVLICPGAHAEAGLAIARRLVSALAEHQTASPVILLETGLGATDPDASTVDAAPVGIETWDGQIVPFATLREIFRADVLLDGRGDEVARTIHDHYRDSIAAQGRDPESEPAGQPWERLGTSYRQANRLQADHVWAKLAVIDAWAVPEEIVETFALAPLEVERLAIIEHARWAADRHLDGWRHAAVRDNALKHHPQLIPYADLTEPMKDLDRFAVRGLPALLARQGLGILRLLIVGVPEPTPDCPGGMRLTRLADQALARLIARYPDRVLAFASTLTDPRTRLLVRRAIAHAPDTVLFLLLPQPLARTLDAQPDHEARRDLLTLTARAVRRIGLDGERELTDWLARRTDINLILGDRVPSGAVAKQVRLDPLGAGLEWTFEY